MGRVDQYNQLPANPAWFSKGHKINLLTPSISSASSQCNGEGL